MQAARVEDRSASPETRSNGGKNPSSASKLGHKMEQELLSAGLTSDYVSNVKQAVKDQVRQTAFVTRMQKRIIKNQQFMLPTAGQN